MALQETVVDDYYDMLGLNSSATAEEIRRAYRILARRYHPDLNPGKDSEEKFKKIASAYAVLSDPDKRRAYDHELDEETRRRFQAKYQAYANAQQEARRPRSRPSPSQRRPGTESTETPRAKPRPKASSVGDFIGGLRKRASDVSKIVKDSLPKFKEVAKETRSASLSLIEVSVSIDDAVKGVKKTVEISEAIGIRKVSVRIPAGVRNGSVVRLRGTANPHEEIVIIVRVASHPFLTIQPKGLVAEIPITVSEAISGANVTVPSLDEPIVIKIPPGTQSGSEIRIKERGITTKDGGRGDLFYKLMIKVPEAKDAPGLKEKSAAFDEYYGTPVRSTLVKNLLDPVS